MCKESFITYLKTVSAENSGKPASYAKAMKVIEDVFFSEALASTTDIWQFISLDNIDAIYEVVLKEQRNEDGMFKNYEPASYWKNGYCSAALKEYKDFLIEKNIPSKRHDKPIERSITPFSASGGFTFLPKPFLLLAGISGTGKTRFIREQAKASAAQYGIGNCANYCLVPARPDWHEPSDLLGYISRIGAGGARYIVTDLLRFIASAWKHAAVSASADGVVCKPFADVCPFWLCLDEMNLAPVEQYFADYLSILETRTWEGDTYACDPLLKPAVIQQLDAAGQDDLWEKLGINDAGSAGLRECFLHNGISLPPNLIVAGTVNMDETTHGFSRKVIDRALTLDFGEFFPNDYGRYFEEDKKTVPRTLGFSRLAGVRHERELAGAGADPDGRKTIAFLGAVKEQLDETPFALAFRALNEALLMLICFQPADEAELQAVWDDFLMMKVLPRIEGDAEKLDSQDDSSLLTRLVELLRGQLSGIAVDRIDLLNQSLFDDTPVRTKCRSLKKLVWMQRRLTANGFTAFWP